MSDGEVIDFLRVRFARVDETLDEIKVDLRGLTGRIGRLERSIADVSVQLAEHSVRMGRMADDIGRIKRRMDLVGAG